MDSRIRSRPVSIVLLPLMAVSLLVLSTTTLAVEYSQKQAVLKLIDQKMRVDGIPGVSFAVVRDGEINWTGALGLANVEQGIAANPESVYRSASLVMPMTATAIMQLQQAGKLDLDAPVWNYCASFPEKPHEVSARQLLTHSAGVRSYAMPWSVYEAELFSTQRYESVSEALSIFADDPLLSAPGSSYEYTHYGYNVLGCVIEAVSEMSYGDYIGRYILEPAGMKSTRIERSEDIVPGRAGVYRKNSKGDLINERYVDLTNKIPSSGLLTTATDMARFAIATMNGTLMPDVALSDMLQPVNLTDGSISHYGMGWNMESVKPQYKGREMYHVGVTPGVTGVMYLYPESNSAVVLFGNLFDVTETEKLAQSIGQIANLRERLSNNVISHRDD